MLAVAALLFGGVRAGDDDDDAADDASDNEEASGGGGSGGGDDGPVTIAFSAPGADHGWLAAITENAEAEASEWDDVEFVLLEGTNDSAAQVSQVEQLIAEDPDVLVILPHEGDTADPGGARGHGAGHPGGQRRPGVLDRRAPTARGSAATTTASACSAGNYFAEQLDCQGNVVEIQGLAGISVTEQRSAGLRRHARAAAAARASRSSPSSRPTSCPTRA